MLTKKFIKIFDVKDTQVAIYKDMLINKERNNFTYLVVAVTPFPHPADKKIFFEQLFSTSSPCNDAEHQDRIFEGYTIEDAGKFVEKLQLEYNNIINKKSGLILPGDVNFKPLLTV